jgi:hypothetical protein
MRQPHVLVVVCAVALAPAGCTDSSVAPGAGGRFRFTDASHSESVRLETTSGDALAQADSLLRSGEARWAAGTPRRGDGGFNAPWHWHLDPATISFAEVTIEACQTWPSAVEQDLDYWIGFGQVCLWGTVQARER